MKHLRFLAVITLAAALDPSTAMAKVGYGYKKSEDPLVLGVKRVVLHARKGEWPSGESEFSRLHWQFVEFRDDLQVDIEERFDAALKTRSLPVLSREVCRVMYFAIVQKFYWNRRERCEKYVPAKSRLEAAIFYYEQILAIGVRDYDRKNRSSIQDEIELEFKILRKSIGTAGLFGIGARDPDLKGFSESSERVLEYLRRVFPYVVEKTSKERSPETERAPND
jgi:hypothetical protein